MDRIKENVTDTLTTIKDYFEQWHKTISHQKIIDTIYPVGAIYITIGSTSPATFLGGEWQRISDRFLLGSADGNDVGYTGGTRDAVVVSHTHTQNAHNHGTGDSSQTKFLLGYDNLDVRVNWQARKKPVRTDLNSDWFFCYAEGDGGISEKRNTADVTATNQYSGVSGDGKNMPPYIIVNIWKRVR